MIGAYIFFSPLAVTFSFSKFISNFCVLDFESVSLSLINVALLSFAPQAVSTTAPATTTEKIPNFLNFTNPSPSFMFLIISHTKYN